MPFRIIGDIERVETIAVGPSVRERRRLAEEYEQGQQRRAQWRKRKGFAQVELPNGTIERAEIHWYEAHGIGRKEFKIKHILI